MLTRFAPSDLNLGDLGIFLLVALVLGHILGWHFVRYAPVMGNKRKLARVFIWISCTTLLIISVVKVSLALSLGLVGALSIIRFRTPIKEPEELAYLFVAVAVGVGLGAERLFETVLVFTVVLAAMALRSVRGSDRSPLRTILHVTVPTGASSSDAAQENAPNDLLPKMLAMASEHCKHVDLRRVDRQASEFQASLLVEFAGAEGLHQLMEAVARDWPNASISVVERGALE